MKRSSHHLVFSLIILLSSVIMAVTSTTAVYAGTLTTLNPVADSYVRKDSPTNNYGTSDQLHSQGTDYRATYMKFDLTSLAGKTINSVKLRVRTPSDGGSQVGHSIKLISDSSWTETGITYNNSINGSNTGYKPSTQLASISSAAGNSWVEISLDASVVSTKKGALFSLAMVPNTTSEDEIKFPSREATDKPQLVIDYTSSPTNTPTTAATNTPTRTPTRAATSTPTRTPTRTPTAPAGATNTPTRAANTTPTRTPTATTVPTVTLTPTPTTTVCQSLVPPSSLSPSGTVTTSGNTRFTWAQQPGAVKYAIRIDDVMDDFGFNYDTGLCKATNADDICTDGLTNNAFQFPLVPGHSYRWWVHAINSCNNWSTAASVDITVPGPKATPTTAANPVSFSTSSVKLTADDFYIMANGKKFLGNQQIVVHSDPADPGIPAFTTLETIWYENNVEMRLFMYFKADTTDWKLYEMRTYNGNNPGNWIMYKDDSPVPWMKAAIGSPYIEQGSNTIKPNPGQPDGEVYFKNLKVQAFLKTSPTPSSTPICATHSKGDANCDGQVDFIDFEIWRQETMDEVNTKNADFNGDTVVDFIDFEIWRQGYFEESPYPSIVISDPAPTCAIKPACNVDNNQCAALTPPAQGWCPISVTPTPSATADTPTPTATDSVTPTPTTVGQDATITPTPTLFR